MELFKNDIVYYARYLPKTDIDEILELRIRTVGEDWYVGTEEKTHMAFMFYKKDINVKVFSQRSMALECLKDLKLTEK